MSRKKTDSIWLGISIFCFLVLGVSFLLMPMEEPTVDAKISGYALAAGVMFWSAILGGTVTQCVLAHRRRKWFAANPIMKTEERKRLGLISFFKNPGAIVADSVMILSLAGLIPAMILTHGTGYICYVLVALLVFSFSMHCILNGKVYDYITRQEQLQQAAEAERTNKQKQERKKKHG